jgi:EF hand domain-containing protein
MTKGPDGKPRYVTQHGDYKAVYDPWGRLERIEHDSNGDGKPDRILRHDGAKQPHRVEIDADFDGRIDRWEDFTPEGALRRWAMADDGRPRLWTVLASDGSTSRYEYDRDGDGRIERAEIVVGGRIGRVELDTDRDGKVDRWQDWAGGTLRTESLDTDADGRPDRRLSYGPKGTITGVERLSP